MQKSENFNQLYERICKEQNLKNPVELLIGLANGKDLTTTSAAYDFVKVLEEQHGEDLPDDYDYLELIEIIKRDYEYYIVDVETQLKAQKTLVEYQHPKRKAIENTNVNSSSEISQLTGKEVDIFMKKFNDKY